MPMDMSDLSPFMQAYFSRRRELELDAQKKSAEAEQAYQFDTEQKRLREDSAQRAQQWADQFKTQNDQWLQGQEQEAAKLEAQGLFKPGEKTITSTPKEDIVNAIPGGKFLPLDNLPPILTSTAIPKGGYEFGKRVMVPVPLEERAKAQAASEIKTSKAKTDAAIAQRLELLNKILEDNPEMKKDSPLVQSLTLQAHGLEEPKEAAVQTILNGFINDYMNAPDEAVQKKALTKYKLFRDFYQADYSFARPTASTERQRAVGRVAQNILDTVKKRMKNTATSAEFMKAALDVAHEYPNELNAEALEQLLKIVAAPKTSTAKPLTAAQMAVQKSMGGLLGEPTE
jgi:hypothetical protein